MTSDHIIDVSEENFEFEVINYSSKIPVVVDFWASWCVPCRVLEPMLHRFAQDAEGTFRLARVNVDENQKLAERLKIKKLPAVKAFVDGRIVSEFTGVLTEPNLREFLAHLTPAQSDLLLEKANSLLLDSLWTESERTFREFLLVSPNHPAALLGLVKSLIRQGKVREAELILVRFPASAEFHRAERLRSVVKAFNWLSTDQNESTDPLEAAYRNGLKIALRGNILAAMDGFLDIIRKDKHYRNDEVRDVFIGLLELLGEGHPEVRQYRNDLSNLLF